MLWLSSTAHHTPFINDQASQSIFNREHYRYISFGFQEVTKESDDEPSWGKEVRFELTSNDGDLLHQQTLMISLPNQTSFRMTEDQIIRFYQNEAVLMKRSDDTWIRDLFRDVRHHLCRNVNEFKKYTKGVRIVDDEGGRFEEWLRRQLWFDAIEQVFEFSENALDTIQDADLIQSSTDVTSDIENILTRCRQGRTMAIRFFSRTAKFLVDKNSNATTNIKDTDGNTLVSSMHICFGANFGADLAQLINDGVGELTDDEVKESEGARLLLDILEQKNTHVTLVDSLRKSFKIVKRYSEAWSWLSPHVLDNEYVETFHAALTLGSQTWAFLVAANEGRNMLSYNEATTFMNENRGFMDQLAVNIATLTSLITQIRSRHLKTLLSPIVHYETMLATRGRDNERGNSDDEWWNMIWRLAVIRDVILQTERRNELRAQIGSASNTSISEKLRMLSTVNQRLRHHVFNELRDGISPVWREGLTAYDVFSCVELWIGDVRIDAIHKEMMCAEGMFANNDESKVALLTPTRTPISSTREEWRLALPLRWWFCLEPHQALPLCALRRQRVEIRATLAQWCNLVEDFPRFEYAFAPNAPPALLPNSIRLSSQVILLTASERRIYNQPISYVIIQRQHHVEQRKGIDKENVEETSISKDTSSVSSSRPNESDIVIQLPFSHAVREIQWSVILEPKNPSKEISTETSKKISTETSKGISTATKGSSNGWIEEQEMMAYQTISLAREPRPWNLVYAYSLRERSIKHLPKATSEYEAKLSFGANITSGFRPASYFEILMPRCSYVGRAPMRALYSFALFSASGEATSGHINLSALHNKQLIVRLNQECRNRTLTIQSDAQHYNTARIANGILQVDYY